MSVVRCLSEYRTMALLLSSVEFFFYKTGDRQYARLMTVTFAVFPLSKAKSLLLP
jgi:hypothetical protein